MSITHAMRALTLILIASNILSCAPDGAGSGDAPPPRRILWITVDSLRTDHLSGFGYDRDTSPWLDQLAEQSVTFEWAIAPANETVSSVAAFFSGVPYSSLHENTSERSLPASATTIAEQFQAAGYRTIGYTANPRLHHLGGYDQGFEDWHYVKGKRGSAASIDDLIGSVKKTYEPTSKPEFVYVHTMDVHHPYRPPAPYDSRYTTRDSVDAVQDGNMYLRDSRELVWGTQPYWSERHDVRDEDIQFLIALYDGAIRYTDAKLPMLLKALDWQPGVDLLIVTSDHGEHLFEQQWWRHFATLTPMEVRVPLFMHHADLPAKSVATPVSLLDLFPTLADWSDISAPDSVLGESLLPGLLDGLPFRGEAWAEAVPQNGQSAMIVDQKFWYGFTTVRNYLKPWKRWPCEEHLYAHVNDPRAGTDLIDATSDVADRMNARLREVIPRWSPYTRDRLIGTDRDVAMGENLLDGPCCGSPAHGTADDTQSAAANTTAVEYGPLTLEPYAPHLVRFPYTLQSGTIELSLWNAETGVRDWRYVLARPVESPRIFEATIFPKGGKGTLRIEATDIPAGDLAEPELHPLIVSIPEAWPRISSAVDDAALPKEEQETLRSLGYLD